MDMLSIDSDWESSSDSGSSDGIGELEFMYGGHAGNLLSSLEETIDKIDDFLSFEREFTRGDIVCAAVSGLCDQMGKVINVNIYVDLENVRGKTVKNVRSNELLKICPMSEGDYVVHGPWVGKVNKIVDMVSVVFDDGTKCEVLATDRAKLVPLSPNKLEDFPCLYYPGQRIQIELSAASKSSSWLCGTRKESHNVGTVAAVKAGQVDVHWIACAHVGCESFPAPRRSQDADNLILLSSFLHENWQLGEWCMLPGAGSKCVKEQTVLTGSVLEIIKEHHNLGKGFSKQECHPIVEDLFTIVKMKTMVDVLWQNGCCSTGLDSESLLPVDTVNAHEFWPWQFVLQRCTSDDPHADGSQTCGVVSEVDAKEQTVKVKWKSSNKNNVISNLEEEIVSAYELVEHPDYSFCFGDVVFKNTEKVENEYGVKSSKASVQDHIDYPYDGFLSCIGCVTGFKNGAVEVTWASGQQTETAPSDIFRLSKYEGSTSPLNEHEGEESPNDVVDHTKQVSGQTTKDVLHYNDTGKEAQNNPEEHTSFLLPQFSIGFFKGLAASLFGSFCSTSVSGSSSTGPIYEAKKDAWEARSPSTEMQSFLAGEAPGCEKMTSKEVVNDIQANIEYKCMSSSSSCGKFKQFDMVVDCSDHQFLNGQAKGSASSQVKRGWLKKVQQEWSTLEKDLPESIYVRIYEERMDLLRAAIVGAPGTPYHDGLFFFDIYLPPEYPHEPPLVHYRSGGLRVNPNLYESGKVCLSLLNTWQGTGSEVWNPESSSILQVLLSLQALVLNDKPYFNEAGYDKQIGRADGERNSVSYNENAFLLTWKSMLYLLLQPPKHFEALVDEHVRQRAPSILSSCKAYLEGAPVATAFGHGHADNGSQKGSSTGFKIMLAKLVPKLVETFSDKGVDCSGLARPENPPPMSVYIPVPYSNKLAKKQSPCVQYHG